MTDRLAEARREWDARTKEGDVQGQMMDAALWASAHGQWLLDEVERLRVDCIRLKNLVRSDDLRVRERDDARERAEKAESALALAEKALETIHNNESCRMKDKYPDEPDCEERNLAVLDGSGLGRCPYCVATAALAALKERK